MKYIGRYKSMRFIVTNPCNPLGMADNSTPESRAEQCLRFTMQQQTDPGSCVAHLTMAQQWMDWAANRGKNLRGDALLPTARGKAALNPESFA
jgi:hypothetical protein